MSSTSKTAVSPEASGARAFLPGQPWMDTEGTPIEAHGGGILFHDGVYYWYGEDHRHGIWNKTGISCYSSTDLLHWTNQGVVLPKQALEEAFQDTGVMERPKVIYNPRTKLFVMWAHMDDRPYKVASAGIATCAIAHGIFTYHGYSRPIPHPAGGIDADPLTRQKELGSTFRDMNLFVDDDGAAYVFYAAEDNATMYVSRLNEDFTGVATPAVEGVTWARIFINRSREAPAPFKHRGRYYVVTSGCTGWGPNPAEYGVAERILGPWRVDANPCRGAGAETTFRSQSTCVIPAPGKPAGSFIYMGDRWDSDRLEKSTYVWLPFVIGDDRAISLEWFPRWELSIFDDRPTSLEAPRTRAVGDTRLEWDVVPRAHGYRVFRNGLHIATTIDAGSDLPPVLAGRAYAYTVVAFALGAADSPPSDAVIMHQQRARDIFLSELEADHATQGYGTLKRDRSVVDAPLRIGERAFARGLGTHAVSTIAYGIGGRYASFEAWAGVDAQFKRGTMSFEVYADARKVFDSGLMRHETPAVHVEVSMNGVHELKLVVTDGGDGIDQDHAVWGDARLSVGGLLPTDG